MLEWFHMRRDATLYVEEAQCEVLYHFRRMSPNNNIVDAIKILLQKAYKRF